MTAVLSFRPRINLHRFTWDAFAIRYVRTAAGARRYGVPIGRPIPTGRRVAPRSMPDGSTRIRLTPAQRAVAGRIFGEGSGANGATHGGGASLDVDNPSAAATALERALEDPDLTPGQRRTVRVLRDKVSALGPQPDADGPAPEPSADPDTPGTPDAGADTRTPDQRMQDRVAVQMLERMRPEARQQILDGMSPDERRLIEEAVARERPEGIEGIGSPQAEPERADGDANATPSYTPAPRSSPGDWADREELIEARARLRNTVGDVYADPSLAAIWELQGFNGLPTVVSAEEFDALPDDHIRLFRGIEGPDGDTRQAEEWAEQYRSGQQPYPGLGMLGNGTYTGVSRETADRYMGDGGAMLEMALSPNARVIDLEDFTSASFDWADEVRAAGERGAIPLTGDLGRRAAAMGYDAVRVPDPDPGVGDYFIVHNRTALTIREGAQ